MSSRKVVVTGGAGFVGAELIRRLVKDEKFSITAALRSAQTTLPADVHQFIYQGLDGATSWGEVFESSVDTVIHLAARVHVMRDHSLDPLAEFRKVNVEGTLRLAKAAADGGVRRFIFISSIKVNGESTPIEKPFRSDDECAPVDPYGISKYEAEQGLRNLAMQTGMEVVIIRPVLVYGPGVKGNFRSLIKAIEKGVPLPLGAAHNLRSLVSVFNLVDLIVTCIHHEKAANQIFLVSDDDDMSTPALAERIAFALNKPARLLNVPRGLLEVMARLAGKQDAVSRLFESLRVDITKTTADLGWRPSTSKQEALRATVMGVLEAQK